MTSKEPVTLKDGTKVRPIDVYVATLAPNPPADELARLALAGEILDIGVQVVDCIGEKDGKPHDDQLPVVGPDIKRVNELIPGATSVLVRHLDPGLDLRRDDRRGQDRPARRDRSRVA